MLRHAGGSGAGAGVRADGRGVVSPQLRQASLQEGPRLWLQTAQEIIQEEIVQAAPQNQEDLETQEAFIFWLKRLLKT